MLTVQPQPVSQKCETSLASHQPHGAAESLPSSAGKIEAYGHHLIAFSSTHWMDYNNNNLPRLNTGFWKLKRPIRVDTCLAALFSFADSIFHLITRKNYIMWFPCGKRLVVFPGNCEWDLSKDQKNRKTMKTTQSATAGTCCNLYHHWQ